VGRFHLQLSSGQKGNKKLDQRRKITAIKKSVSVQDVLELLNEILEKDPECVQSLVNQRVKCNDAVANHPTIQVQKFKKDKYPKVGLIGILNCLFGMRADGMGPICASVIKSGKILKILKFERTPKIK
jgi:hypothetical protein